MRSRKVNVGDMLTIRPGYETDCEPDCPPTGIVLEVREDLDWKTVRVLWSTGVDSLHHIRSQFMDRYAITAE